MVLEPTIEELEFVAAIDHFENFGIFDHTTFSIPKTLPPTALLNNLIAYMRSPAQVLHSSLWPTLSLARHGLSFIRPWYARNRRREIFQ
jgi:hypothetical protein